MIHPVFNETFATLISPDVSAYRVEVKNHHLVGAAGHLGHYDIPTAGRVVSGTFKLEGEPGDITLHSYHVPLELLAVVGQGNHPFVAAGSCKVKTGEGFELPVWYLAVGEAEVTAVASVDGTSVAHGAVKVLSAGVSTAMVPLTPNRVLPLGTHITVTLKLHKGGVKLAQSCVSITVGTE